MTSWSTRTSPGPSADLFGKAVTRYFADMPPFAEPFFMELDADVQMSPVMNPADLEKGLSQIS